MKTDDIPDSDKLKQWRQRMKLTQAQAAKALDASVRAYSDWEGGKTPANGRVMMAADWLEWLSENDDESETMPEYPANAE